MLTVKTTVVIPFRQQISGNMTRRCTHVAFRSLEVQMSNIHTRITSCHRPAPPKAPRAPLRIEERMRAWHTERKSNDRPTAKTKTLKQASPTWHALNVGNLKGSDSSSLVCSAACWKKAKLLVHLCVDLGGLKPKRLNALTSPGGSRWIPLSLCSFGRRHDGLGCCVTHAQSTKLLIHLQIALACDRWDGRLGQTLGRTD